MMWSIYEIIHIRTAVVEESEEWFDHRSKLSNLSNWKEEAWKNQGFNGIRTCDLRDTGPKLYQLSYEATHWVRGQLIYWVHISREKWNDVKYNIYIGSSLLGI